MLKKILNVLLIVLFIPNIVWAIDINTPEENQSIEDIYSNEEPNKDDYLEDSYDYNEEKDIIDKQRYINNETNYKVIIDDMADLIKEEEEKELLNVMKPLTKHGHIAFVSINKNSYFSTSSYASNYYHNSFGTQSGSLFLIDMELREIYIFSDGANYNTITSSKAYLITDNIYKKATAEKYFDCAKEAYKEMNDLLEGKEILEPMRHITNALISITLAFFATFIFMINKSKIPKASDKQLLEYSNISFELGKINAEKTGTSKKYSPPSSSGGSGSSGGGGGGGGSSGGGGGHSF